MVLNRIFISDNWSGKITEMNIPNFYLSLQCFDLSLKYLSVFWPFSAVSKCVWPFTAAPKGILIFHCRVFWRFSAESKGVLIFPVLCLRGFWPFTALIWPFTTVSNCILTFHHNVFHGGLEVWLVLLQLLAIDLWLLNGVTQYLFG